MAGVICVAAGLAKFGFIAELLSAPVRYGYLHGIAITIIVSQSAKLCGFSVPGESVVRTAAGVRRRAPRRQVQRRGRSASASPAWPIILVLRHISKRLPATLLAVVVGIVVSLLLHLDDHGVPLVGDLPRGIPVPALA